MKENEPERPLYKERAEFGRNRKLCLHTGAQLRDTAL